MYTDVTFNVTVNSTGDIAVPSIMLPRNTSYNVNLTWGNLWFVETVTTIFLGEFNE